MTIASRMLAMYTELDMGDSSSKMIGVDQPLIYSKQ